LDDAIAAFIKSNWSRPSRAAVGEDPGPVRVDVTITKDGRIIFKGISRSSGNGALDRTAVKAIKDSGRLPRHLKSRLSVKHHDVTIVFSITDEA
jgi:TonB family protein